MSDKLRELEEFAEGLANVKCTDVTVHLIPATLNIPRAFIIGDDGTAVVLVEQFYCLAIEAEIPFGKMIFQPNTNMVLSMILAIVKIHVPALRVNRVLH